MEFLQSRGQFYLTTTMQYIANMQNWRCIANQHVIEFSRDEMMSRERLEFYKEEFEGECATCGVKVARYLDEA